MELTKCCRVSCCRFAWSHLTCSHLCMICKNFGHGVHECDHNYHIEQLRNESEYGVFPVSMSCAVCDCPRRTIHHTDDLSSYEFAILYNKIYIEHGIKHNY